MNATLDLDMASLAKEINRPAKSNIDIVLGSDQDFIEALQQVMHVAEHSGLSPLTPPLRIAIEVQTPPGAVVTVYISRQNDQFRAQLSANDSHVLTWVQDQIGSLRASADDNVVVRWLPPQLETGYLSHDQSASFAWGEDQSRRHPRQDEFRQNQGRQKKPTQSGNVSLLSHGFSGLAALGRAA